MDLLEANDKNLENEKHHWWIKTRQLYLDDAIKKIHSDYKRNLVFFEVGSGTAPNIKHIKEKYDYKDPLVALDIEYKKPFYQNNIHFCKSINQVNDRCDVLVAMDVLEHIEDDLMALGLWSSKLIKDEGYVFCTVPAFNFLWSKHDEKLKHFRRYNKKELIQRFEKSDFKVVDSGYVFFFTTFFLYIMRKLISRQQDGGFSIPSSFFNKLLIYYFYIEFFVNKIIKLPFGSSVYLLAKKKA